MEVERGFARLMTIDNTPTHEVDEIIDGAAMVRMLKLEDIFQLVIHGFNDSTLAAGQTSAKNHRQHNTGRVYSSGEILLMVFVRKRSYQIEALLPAAFFWRMLLCAFPLSTTDVTY